MMVLAPMVIEWVGPVRMAVSAIVVLGERCVGGFVWAGRLAGG